MWSSFNALLYKCIPSISCIFYGDDRMLWAGWAVLCHFSCFLKSILLILKATLGDQWRASRMLLYKFIPSILCHLHRDIPYVSYAVNRISDWVTYPAIPYSIRSWNQDYSQGFCLYFIPFNEYYPTYTTCLEIRKAFNKREILSACQITSFRLSI